MKLGDNPSDPRISPREQREADEYIERVRADYYGQMALLARLEAQMAEEVPA